MSNDKFTRKDNLIAIREALVENGASDLALHIDALLRQEPTIKGNQHRGDSIYDAYSINLPQEISQQILDVLATIPDLEGHDAVYAGKQIGFLVDEFRRLR